MPKCYQLIGVPGSGKSTWINQQDWAGNCVIASTDNHVEAHALQTNSTYSDVFKEFMPRAVDLMAADVVSAREKGLDVIWDQTSTTHASRARKFRMLPGYQHIAVIFATPEINELKRRLSNRPGKNIPWNVVSGMINNFEMPTLEEGFEEIWHAQ